MFGRCESGSLSRVEVQEAMFDRGDRGRRKPVGCAIAVLMLTVGFAPAIGPAGAGGDDRAGSKTAAVQFVYHAEAI